MAKPTTAESLREYFSSGKNKAAWETAKAKAKEAASYGTFDDGKYDAQLTEIKINRSQASNRLQVVIAFRFVGGDYAKKPIRKYIGVEEGAEWLLRDLKVLGYDDVDLDDEETIFKKLNKEKPEVKIQLKTKEGSEFQNIYILGLADGAATEEEESEEEDGDTEEDTDDSDEPKAATKESGKSDDDDDESGEEESEDDSDDDDEDEEGSEEGDEEDTEDEDDSEEKVVLKTGMKLKIQLKNEVKIGTVVNLDEEDKDPSKHRAKIKFKNGDKTWVNADKIIDVVE